MKMVSWDYMNRQNDAQFRQKRSKKNLKVIQPMCHNSVEFMHARYNGTQLKCCICIFINKIKCIDCRKLQK